MPHLTLEYTNNLPDFDVQQALTAFNTILIRSGHFEVADIKSRATRLDHFRVGNDSIGTGFAHLTLKLLEGRSTETKGVLAQDLLAALRSLALNNYAAELQLSVEICEIDRLTYAKTTK